MSSSGGFSTLGLVFFSTFVLLAFADWLAVSGSYRWARSAIPKRAEYALKPLCLSALIAAVSTSVPMAELGNSFLDQRKWWFVSALCLSLAGDVFLMLPSNLFEAGLGSFLLAHIAYIAGLTRGGSSIVELAVVSAAIAIGSSPVSGRIMGNVFRKEGTEVFVATSAYMVALTVMAASAVTSGMSFAAAGGMIFLVSDATLAWDRFVAKIPYGRVPVMVTYHVAQGLLAASLFIR